MCKPRVMANLKVAELDSGLTLVLCNGKELEEIRMSNIGCKTVSVLIHHPFTVQEVCVCVCVCSMFVSKNRTTLLSIIMVTIQEFTPFRHAKVSNFVSTRDVLFLVTGSALTHTQSVAELM